MLATGQSAPGQALAAVDLDVMAFLFGMFVVGAALVDSGYLYRLSDRRLGGIRSPSLLLLALLPALEGGLRDADTVRVLGVTLSRLVSNVPLVALRLPALLHAGAAEDVLLALAAGSTLAGNLLLMGAASNVIIVEQAERRGETLGFWEFARIGVPLTAAQMAVFRLLGP